MGESKGGHAGKDKEDKEKTRKIMIEFQGDSLDSYTIINIERGMRANLDNEDGVEYIIKLVVSLYPGEKIYAFNSEEARETALTKLKAKMQMLGIVFM